MNDINPLVFNRLLNLFARSELNKYNRVEEVVDKAFENYDDLRKIYEYISKELNIKFTLTSTDVINIISMFYTNNREKEMRLKLFKTKPYWWLIIPDEERIKKYLIAKLITMLDTTSALSQMSVPTPTLDTVVSSIKEGSIPPASELSTSELIEILKKLAMSRTGKMQSTILKKNINPSSIPSLTEILNELSTRELSKPDRKILTEFIKTLIDYMKSMNTLNNNEKVETIEKLKQTIIDNYHNIEVDEELIEKINEIDEAIGYGLFYSHIDKIVEEDASKLIKLLPEILDANYEDLFETIKQKLINLTLTKTSWFPSSHKKQIDYRRTIYATIKNAEVPKIVYTDRKDTIGDIIFLIDASGSMRSITKYRLGSQANLDSLQVSIITAWLFIRAIKEFGNGEYKLLLFADKIIDLTNYELEKIITLVKTPNTIHKIIGGGTNLYPALKHIMKKYSSPDKNLIIITDTGDMAIGDNKYILKQIKQKSKNLIVACPGEFFNETVKPFKQAGIPLIKYDSYEELIDKIKESILNSS